MLEIWKKIDGSYEVSNTGKIYSHCTQKNLKGRDKTGKGYLSVTLEKEWLVHRLVAKYFLAEWDENQSVHHKDGNPRNNNIQNLQMLPYGDNVRGLHITKEIWALDIKTEKYLYFSDIKDCVKYTNISKQRIEDRISKKQRILNYIFLLKEPKESISDLLQMYPGKIKVTDIIKNKVYQFDSIVHASKDMNLVEGSMRDSCRNKTLLHNRYKTTKI